MKCHVCDRDTLTWSQKLGMSLFLPMRCSHCDARYLASLFDGPLTPNEEGCYDVLATILVHVLALPVAIFFLLSVHDYGWWIVPLAFFVIRLIWMALIPHRINQDDPINQQLLHKYKKAPPK